MKYFSLPAAFAVCLSLLANPGGALAQASGEALMNAISFKPIPPGASFSVEALDNSDQNITLTRAFENTLRGQGHAIHPQAPFVITFEVRNEMGAYTTRNKRAVLELDAHGGREGGEDARMRFNLFDSNSGGMFNQGKGDTTVQSLSQYRLDVSIENRSNGKRHWQVWVVTDLDRPDGTDLVRAMLPEVVAKIGQKVKSHRFNMD